MIKLEKFTSHDFDRFISWIDNERFMSQFAGAIFEYPVTHQQLELYISAADRKIFRVIDDTSGRVIGHAEINKIDVQNGSARFCRLLIAKETDRNKGYGSQLMRELLKMAFENLGLTRIDLGVFEFNAGAIKCYENCGFQKESLLENAFKIEGISYSTYNMCINRGDWKKCARGENYI